MDEELMDGEELEAAQTEPQEPGPTPEDVEAQHTITLTVCKLTIDKRVVTIPEVVALEDGNYRWANVNDAVIESRFETKGISFMLNGLDAYAATRVRDGDLLNILTTYQAG